MHTSLRAGRFFFALLSILALERVSGRAATLTSETLDAWNEYVAATEARIERELQAGESFLVQDFSPGAGEARQRLLRGEIVAADMTTTDRAGREISIPGGMVHHWRGSVFVPGVTQKELLQRLQHPSETGPHQEDVLELRVLERTSDRLRLYIKMTRSKVVTVTYSTEHDVTYRAYGPTRASSRSVATKIAELDQAGTLSEREKPIGEDRGFLWQLHSYWRYQEVTGGVLVELESLTLSRDIPFGLGTLIQPLIDRVARESIIRTLENLRETHAARTMRRASVPPRPTAGEPGQSARASRPAETRYESPAERFDP